MDYRAGPLVSFVLKPEIAQQIHRLSQDPVVKPIIDDHSSDFYLMDSAS
jgi:guanine nucleotide-binding protein G(i) subunit alpha